MNENEKKANESAVQLISNGIAAAYVVSEPNFLDNVYAAGLQLLDEFIGMPSPTAETLNNYGVIMFDTQKTAASLSYFIRAVNLNPSFCEPYRNLSIAAMTTKTLSKHSHLLKAENEVASLPHSEIMLEVYLDQNTS